MNEYKIEELIELVNEIYEGICKHILSDEDNRIEVDSREVKMIILKCLKGKL